MQTRPNFSVERMAAGGTCLQIRALGARRHRSPRHWQVILHYMKITQLGIVAIGLMLVGCSTTPRARTLTADQAGSLAQGLANEKAQRLYHCQPFLNGPPAQFVRGHWTWYELRAQGQGDMEATVEFAADGTDPKATVLWLDSRPILP